MELAAELTIAQLGAGSLSTSITIFNGVNKKKSVLSKLKGMKIEIETREKEKSITEMNSVSKASLVGIVTGFGLKLVYGKRI